MPFKFDNLIFRQCNFTKRGIVIELFREKFNSPLNYPVLCHYYSINKIFNSFKKNNVIVENAICIWQNHQGFHREKFTAINFSKTINNGFREISRDKREKDFSVGLDIFQ
jgi:hypothetical protein